MPSNTTEKRLETPIMLRIAQQAGSPRFKLPEKDIELEEVEG